MTGNLGLSNVKNLTKVVFFDSQERSLLQKDREISELKKQIEELKSKLEKPKPQKSYKKRPVPNTSLNETLAPFLLSMINSGKIDYYRIKNKADEYLSSSERKVFDFILQRTVKLKTAFAFISYHEFLNGVRVGNEIYTPALNLSDKTIRVALKSLLEKQLIIRYKFGNRNSYLYLLNLPKCKELYNFILEGFLTYYDIEQLNLVIKRGKKNFFNLEFLKDCVVSEGFTSNLDTKPAKPKNEIDPLVDKLVNAKLNGEAIGFNEKLAIDLIEQNPVINNEPIAQVIEKQLEYLPYRDQSSLEKYGAAKILYNCIKENRLPPATFQEKTQEKQLINATQIYLPVMKIWDSGFNYSNISEISARNLLTQLILREYRSVKNLSEPDKVERFCNKIKKTLDKVNLEQCINNDDLEKHTVLVREILEFYKENS